MSMESEEIEKLRIAVNELETAIRKKYAPTRMEYFVAAALTGILSGPDAGRMSSVRADERAFELGRRIDSQFQRMEAPTQRPVRVHPDRECTCGMMPIPCPIHGLERGF